MRVSTENFNEWKNDVRAGDMIYLSGCVYTARDAAHKRIISMLDSKKPLPFKLENSFIYYAGPTPPVGKLKVGACGPTTSSRMDVYTPRLMDLGLAATIGKGKRSEAVRESIVKNSGLYLCAVGGAGALVAKSVKNLEVIAFDELGCESVKRLELFELPLFVGIDTSGESIFRRSEYSAI